MLKILSVWLNNIPLLWYSVFCVLAIIRVFEWFLHCGPYRNVPEYSCPSFYVGRVSGYFQVPAIFYKSACWCVWVSVCLHPLSQLPLLPHLFPPSPASFTFFFLPFSFPLSVCACAHMVCVPVRVGAGGSSSANLFSLSAIFSRTICFTFVSCCCDRSNLWEKGSFLAQSSKGSPS